MYVTAPSHAAPASAPQHVSNSPAAVKLQKSGCAERHPPCRLPGFASASNIANSASNIAKSAYVQRINVCRTPQGIRALARFYVVVFIPLFFGPYYADVRVGAHSFAFSLFLAIFVSFPPLSGLSAVLLYHRMRLLCCSCLFLLPGLAFGCWRMLGGFDHMMLPLSCS